MALRIPICDACKKEVLDGTLRSGNQWICNACDPRDPEISLRWHPDPGYYTDGAFVVIAHTKALKPCMNCGNLWGSKGIQGLSFKELEDHGMRGFHLSEIEHSPREIVESKRAGARNKCLDHFKQPMKTCKKCS